MKNLLFVLLLILLIQCKPKEDQALTQFPDKPAVPSSIKITHKSLLDKIHQLSLVQDSSGRVALKIEVMMQHHFAEEEDFILPPLGLLPLLATGKLPEQNKNLVLLSEKIKSDLTHMSVEHQLIKAYLEELKQAAKKEALVNIIEFEKEVLQHAIAEEEVFFPAAILVGEYLKLKTAKKP